MPLYANYNDNNRATVTGLMRVDGHEWRVSVWICIDGKMGAITSGVSEIQS